MTSYSSSYGGSSAPVLNFQSTDQVNIFLAVLAFFAFAVVFISIWWFVRKYQVQEAILNIDKNLQKLVDDSSKVTSQSAPQPEDTNNVQLSSSDKQGEQTLS